MKLKQYRNPESAGWLGWLENASGTAVGFVALDGEVVGWDGERVQPAPSLCVVLG